MDPREIVDPDVYATRGYPHDVWTELRRAPLAWVEPPHAKPFWAVVRHADLIAVARQPRRFLNAPRFVVNTEVTRSTRRDAERHLLNMDPPEHGAYRRLVAARFTPRRVEAMAPRIEALAREVLAPFAGDERELDFVTDVAAVLPLAAIAELLGVPREDRALLFQWTNEIAGSADPEYQRGASAGETLDRAQHALFEYFGALAHERRARPRDDLTSALVQAALAGRPLPEFELLSYAFLLVAAGNETTRNATSGGIEALAQHPAELARLRREPGLVQHATEEILRWTSPVIHFCRTAAEDVELGGSKVRAGDSLALFYPSANRDETVFQAPFRFRVDREPNPHLAFGVGEHVCLGAHLARLELRALYAELLARLESLELLGRAQRLRSPVVGGIKHLPVRWRLRP